jgi:DNA-binding NtrC family response regulator
MTAQSASLLLIIDADPGSLELISKALARPGLGILTASSSEEGLHLFCSRRPQIVVTELTMPYMGGMQVLKQIMETDPATNVILMTADYSTQSAVEAVKNGASDCWNKPVSLVLMREQIGKFVEEARKRKCSQQLEDELRTDAGFEGIVGSSRPMYQMLSRVRSVAPYYRTALIVGETGTGKDLVARALHRLSPVASGPYVVINCSAVVETLFESELFGHVKGSFTGATHDKQGFFEQAHGGTLFLDEIGDMPPSTQAKLLRVLQSQELQRVGALHGRKVNVHVVAATNHDLRAAIAEKRFREDLYYRLSMVEIQAPRLADRQGDLSLLERHFVAKFAAQFRKEIRGLTDRAQIWLAQHPWPGNVRELENVIGCAAMMTTTDMIDVEDLPPYLQAPSGPREATALSIASRPADVLKSQERLLIIGALEKAGGNQTRAARILRISRDRLRYRVKKHNLQTSDSKHASAAAG